MSYGFLDIAITPSVHAAQAGMGADHTWQDFRGHREFDRFTDSEAAFIADRDSFYMATVLETGWPYVQHRGGPRGFLKLIDAHTCRLRLQAFDWNCPQHITPRYTQEQVRTVVDPLRARVAQLEAEQGVLRAQLAKAERDSD